MALDGIGGLCRDVGQCSQHVEYTGKVRVGNDGRVEKTPGSGVKSGSTPKL